MTPSSSSTSTATTTGTSLVLVRQPGSCPHEIRPGTTVCLHCRKEERLAASARRRRTFTRIGVALAGVGICGAIVANVGGGAFDLSSLRMPNIALHLRPSSSAASRAPHAAETTTPVYGATDAVPRTAAAVAAPVAAAAPIVAEGRNLLKGPAVAVRAGDVVTVQFDAPETRTRRADKFESIVRLTLPEVYGAAADSALAHLPAGTLVTPGELVTELPSRGVRIALATGGAITVWPETRPGRDGPLVVSYRASATP
ncbi:MAG TPA: hypothetical protein VFJ74_13255 [Gemmatimonadaceae bacterium]|nr:hypothetical protein [Gemmatimonadaceae bacterium]